jgi:hypothetical protein
MLNSFLNKVTDGRSDSFLPQQQQPQQPQQQQQRP